MKNSGILAFVVGVLLGGAGTWLVLESSPAQPETPPFEVQAVRNICSSQPNPGLAADCNVLVEFAYALNYSSRTKSDNWVSYKSVCDWYGVDCTSDGQHVSKLDLPANNLVGELDLAAHIAPLQYVKYVDLTNNKITNTSAAMNLGQAIKTIATSSYENQLVLKLGWNKLEGNLLGLGSASKKFSLIDLRSNKLFGVSYNDLRLSEQPYNEEVAGTQIMLDLYYQVNPAGPRYIGALPQGGAVWDYDTSTVNGFHNICGKTRPAIAVDTAKDANDAVDCPENAWCNDSNDCTAGLVCNQHICQSPQAPDFSCNDAEDLSPETCEALVALYDNTNGDNWNQKDGRNDNTKICEWYGVVCGDLFGETVLREVNLPQNNLVGNLSFVDSNWGANNSLSDALEYLQTLQLAGNSIKIITSDQKYYNLGKLNRVNLANNSLQSEKLGFVTALSFKELNLAGNKLPGNFDYFNQLVLNKNTKLQLDISNNNICTPYSSELKYYPQVQMNTSNNHIPFPTEDASLNTWIKSHVVGYDQQTKCSDVIGNDEKVPHDWDLDGEGGNSNPGGDEGGDGDGDADGDSGGN